MECMRYIRVPKDIKAIKDYDYGVTNRGINFIRKSI